ncbi:MAG: galactose-1-phosphate uridylyltransferase, partial [Deltaproteobacteria bacterium]|nr:galactose-1-phosphate uridylyltransferase [Deltaproteobacteria bacterium]
MSELRQNLITREWVIIATERAARPDQFSRDTEKKPLPVHSESCPFCPGNEDKTPGETFRISSGGDWKIRVVPNKFAALSPDVAKERLREGIRRRVTGSGRHEVIIETPLHNTPPALFEHNQLKELIRIYVNRYLDAYMDPRVEHVIIFKNHGEQAGTSLAHPHSQLAATPVVPTQIRTRVEEATRFFDDTGECVFCQTLREELLAHERIVCETKHFVAFVPYAALSPFHLWIFPRRHMSSFEDIVDTELGDLARILKTVLSKMYRGLKNPDYNYSIRSVPTRDRNTEYFHWYLTIVPRISRTAGFELGSGMFINTTIPEESAAFLRD